MNAMNVSDAAATVKIRVIEASPAEAARAAALAERRVPHLIAARRVVRWQKLALFAALGVAGTAFAFAPRRTMLALSALVALLYLGALLYRLRLFVYTLDEGGQIHVPDDVARSLRHHDLPVYTVLVPAYGEPAMIAPLIAAIEELDYPTDRLDVKLLLEGDDHATIAAAIAAQPPRCFEIILVPPGEPRTKPKACNIGLLRARGEFVTIYDAEDRPEPLQLRRAVAAFRHLDAAAPSGRSTVACLQARLSFYNSRQNILTRWFSVEYSTWFAQMLPALAQRRLPVPLGGTSNHFRRSALDEVGGWDAHNVTEDAELGLRLRYLGYDIDVLDTETAEEANSDFVNWVRQRSRWHKGYLQTYLAYMRSPRETLRWFGLRGFVAFNLIVGGTPLMSLVNPLFWAMSALWLATHPDFVRELFPSGIYHIAMTCFVVGNFSLLYLGVVGTRAAQRRDLLGAAISFPIYWFIMSIAAVKAVTQLITRPFYWEKTVHGLGASAPADAPPAERHPSAA